MDVFCRLTSSDCDHRFFHYAVVGRIGLRLPAVRACAMCVRVWCVCACVRVSVACVSACVRLRVFVLCVQRQCVCVCVCVCV